MATCCLLHAASPERLPLVRAAWAKRDSGPVVAHLLQHLLIAIPIGAAWPASPLKAGFHAARFLCTTSRGAAAASQQDSVLCCSLFKGQHKMPCCSSLAVSFTAQRACLAGCAHSCLLLHATASQTSQACQQEISLQNSPVMVS